jgi:hypothetical protein
VQVISGRIGLLLCVPVRRGQSVYWLGGGGNFGVGTGWCLWVSDRLYVQVSRPFSCIRLRPEMGNFILPVLQTHSVLYRTILPSFERQ